MARTPAAEPAARLELRLPHGLKIRLIQEAQRRDTTMVALIVAALREFLGEGG